ncbi:hypothetical protein TL16_g12067 [Triparma laevis f. inornata]|uniref:Uncharacterized protein n=1 Tax=Triparma laevis f. inornata TaxID=1714386 RepID=A0A9W7BP43_9STRA|nr:hypothetical protein TL16_g12067 [Triparma laevis f. inornata]
MADLDVLLDGLLGEIDNYMENNKIGYAKATIVTISLNLILQLFFVYVQYHNAGVVVMLKEALFVITFTKPGVDAYRVANGTKQRANTLVDPHNEMVLIRVLELLVECIPSTIIQAMALVSEHYSTLSALSLVSSLCTVAFISACISIEKDVSEKSRAESPNFYGLTPLESRSRTIGICICAFFISFFQLSAKAIACALCSVEGSTVLVVYIGAEVAIMFIYKIASGNFMYWWSLSSRRLRLLASVILRFAMKIIMDFTGMMFCRHPLEMGGAFYSLNIAFTPVVCLFLGSRYVAFTSDKERVEKADLQFVWKPSEVYGAIGLLIILQFFTFLLFVDLMMPSYKSTFMNFQSGSEFCIESFR